MEYTKVELLRMTKAELLKIAFQLSIVGRHDMTKDALANNIIDNMHKMPDDTEEIFEDINEDHCDEHGYASESASVSESDDSVRRARKMSYIENAQVGTLVAFKTKNGRVKSAKIINRSSSMRKLKLCTEYGMEFIVPYEDIIWVRTDDKWPRPIFNLLKGLTDENKEQKV